MHDYLLYDESMDDDEGRRALDKKSRGGAMTGNWPGRVPPGGRPNIPYTGTENPGITNSRPIARSEPDLGEGDLEEGYSFRIPMGDQSDPYSG